MNIAEPPGDDAPDPGAEPGDDSPPESGPQLPDPSPLPVNQDVPEAAREHVARVADNISKKIERSTQPAPRGKDGKREKRLGLGWVNHSILAKWEEEILPLLYKQGKSGKDARIDIVQTEPVQKGPVPLGYLYGSYVEGQGGAGAGARLYDYLVDNFHLPTAQGPASYELIVRLNHGGTFLGDGGVDLDAPDVIRARRAAATQQFQHNQLPPGRPAAAPGMGYAAAPPPPPPGYSAPQYPPQQAAAAVAPPVHLHMPPPPPGQPPAPGATDREMGQMERIADLREKLARAEAEAAHAAGAQPVTAADVARIVAEVMDARDRARAVANGVAGPPAAAPPPPAPPPAPAPNPVTGIRQALSDLTAFLGAGDEIRTVIRKVAAKIDPPEVHDAIPVDPAEPAAADDAIPFHATDIPGVNYKGEPVRWVSPKEGKTLGFADGLMAWATANPAVTEGIATRVVDIAEKVANATTINARGEASAPEPEKDPWGGR